MFDVTQRQLRNATAPFALAIGLCWASSGIAQTAADPAPAEATSGEEVVVTGSRLASNPNSVSASPVVSISADELRKTGQNDIAETLREIPALISSQTVADSIDRGSGGVGQATLDLRGLGANRTLVLVNGRRHVSGVTGTQAVDIATIPSQLIDSVEVLTGGASAVYGADAVTGVVNFKLKDDYDGMSLRSQMGVSDKGDGRTFVVEGLVGRNFAEGRGNITFSGSYANDQEIQYGDRSATRDNGKANAGLSYGNPALRFQSGDISAATPNFQRFYSLANGSYPTGSSIPDAADFAADYAAAFGAAPTLTAAEQALIGRTDGAPTLAIGRYPTFAISSNAGLIFRNDFAPFNADVDGNGVADCSQSYIGTAFGGCYVSTEGGGVRPFQDGVISTSTNQYGGDGAVETANAASLIPRSRRYNANLLGKFEIAPAAILFGEAKYARTETFSQNPYNTFYDTLTIAPDNPYIPDALRADADEAGGLLVSRDFLDLGPASQRNNRDTYRVVGGVRGALTPHLSYEVSGNYGRTDQKQINSNGVLTDRLFAALDVVTGPNGTPICRSDISAVAPPTSPFPAADPGFYSFTPGDGTCKPANILNGVNSLSADAVNFITQRTVNRSRLEQIVASAQLTADTGAFLTLPGGEPVRVFAGGEYRQERSRSTFDPLVLGLLPSGSAAGAEGTFVGDVSDNQSLTFDPTSRTLNAGGKFDVYEAFGEVAIPLLTKVRFADELRIGGAARFSRYSTVGNTFTWNVNGIYAPIRDVKIRGSYAKAVRAPNIFELFSPAQGAVFRPADPCEQSTLDSLVAAGVSTAQNRIANCRADGLPAGYSDPLTARFSGTSGGNPDLREETATTWTAGMVVQPRFIPGLTLSADYYNIRIDNAIAAVSAQDIVNSCYDNSSLDNQYCGLFTRNRNPASPTYLGLNFLEQTQLNFGRIETAGVDMSAAYSHRFGNTRIGLNVTATWVDKIDRFFDPSDPSLVNPGLGELGAPEWAGVGSATIGHGAVSLSYRLQYIGKQSLAPVSIETRDQQFGDAGIADEKFIHDVTATVDLGRERSVYVGVNNLTDTKPYITNVAYPVSAAGRFFFVGLNTRF
ncbi:TonB-dependent receptor domain-containing protein [Sphingomonas arantia]|uniref:TonB-dependent receptor domain-containing protein n=1 Tax=Sphingomonas arantia TaxID=1460676 RepID=A0ABW4TUL3_9SPHN